MNENLKKKLIEYTAENAFVQACGIEIWELEEDHAVMGTTARPELLNPMGMLHGGPHRVHRAGGDLRERNAETAGSGNILHVCNAELNEQILDRGKLESILREWLKIRGALC